jgi:hypothetical protein
MIISFQEQSAVGKSDHPDLITNRRGAVLWEQGISKNKEEAENGVSVHIVSGE